MKTAKVGSFDADRKVKVRAPQLALSMASMNGSFQGIE